MECGHKTSYTDKKIYLYTLRHKHDTDLFPKKTTTPKAASEIEKLDRGLPQNVRITKLH